MGASTTRSFIIGTYRDMFISMFVEGLEVFSHWFVVKVVGSAYPVEPDPSRVNNTGHSPIKGRLVRGLQTSLH